MASGEDNKRLLRMLIEEGLNTGNFSILDEHVRPDYRANVPGRPGLATGPDAIKQATGNAVRNLGDEGKKRGMITTLPLALGILQTRGDIRRVASATRGRCFAA